MGNENSISLKEHFEQRLKDLEKRFNQSIKANKEVVKLLFAASDKAITKAEEAQRDYNVRSNEFRGQLDDQAKTLAPLSDLKKVEERVSHFITKEEYERSHKELISKNEISNGYLKEQIEGLATRITELEANKKGASAMWAYIIGIVGILSVIITLIEKFVSK